MANNQYVNKVEYDGQTLIDLTSDTVTTNDVLNGVTFHDRSGAAVQGSVITHNVYDGLDSTSTSDALSANQGKVLDTNVKDVRTLESLGSYSTLASFTAAIDDALSAMANYTTAVYRIQVATAFEPFGKTTYVCRLSKINSTTYGSALFESLNTTVTTHLIKGTKNTTWQFELMALNSDVVGKADSRASGEFSTIKVNGIGSAADTIAFGGGDTDWTSGVNVGGIMLTHVNRQYVFRSKGGTNGKNEDFSLPVHSDGSNSVAYNILTTKDFPFTRGYGVSPGGTTSGDGTNKITFSAPEAPRHCLLCFADQFTWIFCAAATGTTIYSGTIPSGWSLTCDGLDYTLTRTSKNAFRYSYLWI